jgi:hypothetical protein
MIMLLIVSRPEAYCNPVYIHGFVSSNEYLRDRGLKWNAASSCGSLIGGYSGDRTNPPGLGSPSSEGSEAASRNRDPMLRGRLSHNVLYEIGEAQNFKQRCSEGKSILVRKLTFSANACLVLSAAMALR